VFCGQNLYSVSVDVDAIGTKYPLTGQASNQSTASKPWSGSNRSFGPGSAWRTICPFEEAVFFTLVEYRLSR